MEDVSAHLLVGTETHMSAARWSTGESCAIGMGKTKFFSWRLISYAADRRLTCWVQRLAVKMLGTVGYILAHTDKDGIILASDEVDYSPPESEVVRHRTRFDYVLPYQLTHLRSVAYLVEQRVDETVTISLDHRAPVVRRGAIHITLFFLGQVCTHVTSYLLYRAPASTNSPDSICHRIESKIST